MKISYLVNSSVNKTKKITLCEFESSLQLTVCDIFNPNTIGIVINTPNIDTHLECKH